MLDVTERLLGAGALILLIIGGAAIIVMMGHVMIEVLLRTFFNVSIPGTEELVSAYYMIAVVFLPLGYVQRERGHVIVELFTLWLSSRATAWLDGIVCLVCGAALSVFTYAAFDRAIAMTARGEIWIGMVDVLVWPSRWLMAIGLAVMTLILFAQSVREFHAAITGRGHQDPKHPEDAERV